MQELINLDMVQMDNFPTVGLKTSLPISILALALYYLWGDMSFNDLRGLFFLGGGVCDDAYFKEE